MCMSLILNILFKGFKVPFKYELGVFHSSSVRTSISRSLHRTAENTLMTRLFHLSFEMWWGFKGRNMAVTKPFFFSFKPYYLFVSRWKTGSHCKIHVHDYLRLQWYTARTGASLDPARGCRSSLWQVLGPAESTKLRESTK